MSTYLKKSITAIIAAMALGHGIDAYANNSSTGPQTMDTIFVFGWDNPYDVANDAFNWTIADYNAWDVGVSNEGNGGGGGTPPATEKPCDHLRAEKPANCPNPIPFPHGYSYGFGQYAGGSGIPKLIWWIDHEDGVDQSARQIARNGLAYHTDAIANIFISLTQANQSLILAVQAACHQQHIIDSENPMIVAPVSWAEQRCLDVLERVQAESGDAGFRGYFYEWLNREGIHLDDLGIPETVIDLLSPSNSLNTKYNMVSADAKCSKWWNDVQANQCSI